jgi:hypothetical protein
MDESEVQFVMDTYAGETEVPDSQMDIAEVDEPDAMPYNRLLPSFNQTKSNMKAAV